MTTAGTMPAQAGAFFTASNMSEHEFKIGYPLFAFKSGERQYVSYELRTGQPDQTLKGIPVFSSREKALEFQREKGIHGEIKEFDRIGVFRKFLSCIRDAGTIVLFDLTPDAVGNLHTPHAYPAAVVYERFLPEPGGYWGYPVFVLACRDGFACIDCEHQGARMKFLVVMTDSDLADRALAGIAGGATPVPLASAQAFSALVRCQPAGVLGVVFDPSTSFRPGSTAQGMLRDALLRLLSVEI